MVEQVQVLIVDDHPGFRAAAAAVVGSCPGFTVAGEAATGEQAVERIGGTGTGAGAALVLMDVSMPGIGGVEATRRIRATHPQVVIVLLSADEAGDLAAIAAGCGAHAYLPKQGFGREQLLQVWAAARPSKPGPIRRP
jgi:two-component system, NarL family, invasion response regulator UvrY